MTKIELPFDQHINLLPLFFAESGGYRTLPWTFREPGRYAIDTFGGFGVMNTDAKFNDARQGLFVPLLADLYEASGDLHWMERAVAALRACYTTMLIEEHREIAPGNMIHFREADRGAILENYGHTGRDEMTAGYLSPDWGCATALYASGMIRRRFGDLLIDFDAKGAIGIDLCTAEFSEADNGNFDVNVYFGGKRTLQVSLRGDLDALQVLRINGAEVPPEQLRRGKFEFEIDGRSRII